MQAVRVASRARAPDRAAGLGLVGRSARVVTAGTFDPDRLPGHVVRARARPARPSRTSTWSTTARFFAARSGGALRGPVTTALIAITDALISR